MAAHYAERRGLEVASYDEQLASLIERGFGTSDAYSRELNNLGHEATDLVVNCLPLQRTWAAEHGAPKPPRLVGKASWLNRIALRQVAEIEPDVVYVQDMNVFSAEELAELKRPG